MQEIPIIMKTSEEFEWPEDTAIFYLMTKNGLFLCRKHPFWTSSVPVKTGPSHLLAHKMSMTLTFPKIPQGDFEKVMGFFMYIYEKEGTEAAALFVWDSIKKEMSVLIPEQVADYTDSFNWGKKKKKGERGKRNAMNVVYEYPTSLPPGQFIVGDIHSHAGMAPHPSFTDREDEKHRAGFHIIVGDLDLHEPNFHFGLVTDGVPFTTDEIFLLEGYEKPNPDFPKKWLKKFRAEKYSHKPLKGRGRDQWEDDGEDWSGYGAQRYVPPKNYNVVPIKDRKEGDECPWNTSQVWDGEVYVYKTYYDTIKDRKDGDPSPYTPNLTWDAKRKCYSNKDSVARGGGTH